MTLTRYKLRHEIAMTRFHEAANVLGEPYNHFMAGVDATLDRAFEEAAKIAELHAAIEMPKGAGNDKRWRVGHEIAATLREFIGKKP